MTPTIAPGSQQNLVAALFSACGLSWKQATLAIAALLMTGLFLAAWLDGYFASGVDWNFRKYAFYALPIIYMLMMLPVSKRLWEQAIERTAALRAVHEPVRSELPVNRQREAIVLLVGFIIAFSGFPLWLVGEPGQVWTQWTTWYFVATGFGSTILFVWVLYLVALRSLQLAYLCQHELKIDLFQAELLAPYARVSQFSAIALVGGIALTLPLQTLETLRSAGTIATYSSLLIFAVLSFFASLRHIHAALVLSKTSKLAVIRARLQDIRAELERYASASDATDIMQLSAEFAAWSLYEAQVKAASTWPFDHKMVRQVLGSTLVPLGVYLLKLAGGMLERQLMF